MTCQSCHDGLALKAIAPAPWVPTSRRFRGRVYPSVLEGGGGWGGWGVGGPQTGRRRASGGFFELGTPGG